MEERILLDRDDTITQTCLSVRLEKYLSDYTGKTSEKTIFKRQGIPTLISTNTTHPRLA
jgi:hypothetical protein